MQSSIVKRFLSWFTNKNYFTITFIAFICIALSREVENIYLCSAIYLIILIIFTIEIKRSYPFLIFVSLFLIWFLLFYKFDINKFFNLNFYKVVEVNSNYFLIRQFGSLYYVPVGEFKLSVGEVVSLVGEFEKVSIKGNFWEFDFNSYLLNKNVKYKIIDAVIEIKNIKSLQYFFFKIVNSTNNLTKLMFFQQKTNSLIYKNLNSYSLGYLINLSGMNVYLLSGILNKKVFAKWKNYKKYRIIPITFLFYYCYLLNFKLFLLKSCILLIIGWVEQNKKFKFSKITKLSILWIACLFINPLFIFNIGFIFSVIAFIFLKKYKNKKPATNVIYNFLIVNAVFTPVQIFYNYKIYWFSSLFEVLLIPLVTFSFITSLFFFIPFSSYILNLIYKLFYFYSKGLTYLNLTTICGSFNFIYLISYFVLFKLITSFSFDKTKIKKLIIFIFTLNCFWILQSNQFTKISPSVTMLNVGNGNSFLFQYKGKTILFDAGRGNGFSKSSLEQYLVYSGVRKIEAVFISHNHQDHFDQLGNVANTYKLKNVFYNYHLKETFNYKDLNITNFIELGNSDENDNSQVSLIEVKNKKILFTGDTTKLREYRLIKDELFLNKVKGGVDFLQVGHHGSKTSTSEVFMKVIQPKTCFISGHKSNTLDFPSKETLDTLNKYKCKTYVTNGDSSYKYKVNSEKTIKIQKNSF
ncbi:ComEC/Rec2 family competence protein [Spiroplasma monobiae]|uniref:Competence protein ComEC n=1 Tax=Spiroplasma monobiae MQ-1 TaxID=1336748 RepID=A0A2K9LUH2_SPISQ|nr:ComEC/Rec2 family competence protein [Spiroplasma monobiae]AUM62698.1 competence protein ComEC [Spiroplasma monobiae MQ-1]